MKKKKKIINYIILYLKKNYKKIIYRYFMLDSLFKICFFFKNINYSDMNIADLLEINSRRKVINFLRNSRKKIYTLIYLYLQKKKIIENIEICTYNKKWYNKQFLSFKIYQNLNTDNIVLVNKIVNNIKNNYKNICFFIYEISFFKKFTKIMIFVFFFNKINTFKSQLKINKNKILFKFFHNHEKASYSYFYIKKSSIDSLINIKIFKTKSIQNFFLFFYKKKSMKNKNIKFKIKVRSVNSISFFIELINIYIYSKYLLLNFEYFKLILKNTIFSLKTNVNRFLYFYIALLYSSSKIFNNFILLLLFDLKKFKKIEKKFSFDFFHFLFSKVIFLRALNLKKFSKYLQIIFLLSSNSLNKLKEFLIFNYFFRFIIKILKYVINSHNFIFVVKTFSPFYLSNILRNKFYLKINYNEKKKEIFNLVKCKKCFFLTFEFFLKIIYYGIYFKQNIFWLFKSNFIIGLNKSICSHKLRNLLFLLVIKLKKKKIKTGKIRILIKTVLKTVFYFLKNLIINSKLNLKKLIWWIEQKLKKHNSFVCLLFIIDNNAFLKFTSEHIKHKPFNLFGNIILNKIQRIIILIFLEKLNIFIDTNEKIVFDEDHLLNFYIIHSNFYTLLGPNRNHILNRKSIRLVQANLFLINFLKTSTDLITIIILGSFSRVIHSYLMKILYIKKKKKNQCFQLREIFKNLYFSSEINNIFYIKYLFMLFKFFLNNKLLSLEEIVEKFFFLSFFILNDYRNQENIDFFIYIFQHGPKQAFINFEKGLKKIVYYCFVQIDNISEREKVLKNKCIKITKKWFVIFFKIILKNKKNNLKESLLKFFLLKLLISCLLNKNSTNQGIFVLLNDFLKILKKKSNFYKKFPKICKSMQNFVNNVEQKIIKNLIQKNYQEMSYKKWIYICKILIFKVFNCLFFKNNINPILVKNFPNYFEGFLDISELNFIYKRNWTKNVHNFINMTNIY